MAHKEVDEQIVETVLGSRGWGEDKPIRELVETYGAYMLMKDTVRATAAWIERCLSKDAANIYLLIKELKEGG